MKTTKVLEQLNKGDEITAAAIRQLLAKDSEEICDAADEIGLTADLLIESALEQAAKLADDEALADRIRSYWLELEELPDGSAYEINVRSAEFLAARHRSADIGPEEVATMADSKQWRERLVAAWILRDKSGSPWEALREKLKEDEFTDDNGNHLVREGLGIHS